MRREPSAVTLLLATTNPDKVREIRHVLGQVPVRIATLADGPPVPEPREDGASFAENARIKALYYDRHVAPQVPSPQGRVLTVAEDSGLDVDGLGGEPGIHSARFLRPDATYPERFAEIERRLAVHPTARRTARFHCAVAVADAGRIVHETAGVVEGEIIAAPRGTAGFGYDPIFWYPQAAATFAELTAGEKLRVAHRGMAFRRLASWLESPDFRGL